MKSKLEHQCRQLSPEDANTLCDILLVQCVSDDFFQGINPVNLRHHRRVFKLKQWLLARSEQWHREDIQAISDIGVQNVRDLQGHLDRRIFIFSAASTGGYICISSGGQTASGGFAGWISDLAPELIALHDELK